MYRWNEDKNSILKATRGVSFNDVTKILADDGILDNYKHPQSDKYPNQYIYVISINNYIYYIPYVIDKDFIFLKNIIPSRKLNKIYNQKDKK